MEVVKVNKKIFLSGVMIFFLRIFVIYGIDIYSGNINGSPIEVVLNLYSDGVGSGVYSYKKYGIPIPLDITLKDGTLLLKNKDEKMIFNNFNIDDSEVDGKWEGSDKSLKVRLKKEFEFDYYDKTEFKDLELLASNSTKNEFFKFLLEKQKGKSARVTGVNIYSKKNKKLLQKIELDCAFIGPLGIDVGDYNFDGEEDFSIFEASYTGPNTSSLYILKNKENNNFFISSFQGSSLEFDSKNKKVYSRNQSRAGASHITQEFIIEKNKLILKKETTLEYNEELDDFERKETFY